MLLIGGDKSTQDRILYKRSIYYQNRENVMVEKVSDFDVSEYLDDEKSIAAYLSAVVEENDTKLLLAAIGDIAKARGMAKIASDSGLGRESLYKALNPEAKPRFDTILKVLISLGVKIRFNAITEEEKKTNDKKASTVKKSIQKRKSHLSDRPIDRRHANEKARPVRNKITPRKKNRTAAEQEHNRIY